MCFTDLTPSPAVTEMIGRFGFVQRHAGALLVALPVAAFARAAAPASSTASRRRPTPRSSPGIAELGCLVLRLVTASARSPLVVLSVASRRGLPVARLIYATDLAAVRAPSARSPAISSRAARPSGNARRPGDSVPGGWFTRRARPTFFRGTPPAAAVDHAYSEFVFLRI